MAFNQVAQDFSMPTAPFGIGLGMPGPTILELGTRQQKLRYLPPLVRGEEIWCQLFSEPDGGSDVASLQTSAARTATGWRVNGQKVWTSVAQHADFGALLARTDPTVPKHQGITMFIVDMHHPGVTVRPLVVATGIAPFNEVFFDDVDIPADAAIGEVNRGWDAAVVMLRNERISIGAGMRARANPLSYDTLLGLARTRGLTTSDSVRRQLAEVYARESAIGAYGRVLHEDAAAGQAIGARGSVAKLAGAQQQLWVSDIAQEILGEDVALGGADTERVAMAIISGPGHRGRHLRDPAQHHRRARPRAAQPQRCLDATRSVATATFDRTQAVPVAGDAVAAIDHAADLANLAVAAEQVGAIRACIDMTASYAKTRYSFGNPIGAYQGVKHRIADMYTDWGLAAAAAARVVSSPAYVNAAKYTMLLHGGIGFTWEHNAHLYYRNAVTSNVLLGGPQYQRSRLADKLGV
jgi:alkylation response protein AidB-like acyl-CoA dehydrogenase